MMTGRLDPSVLALFGVEAGQKTISAVEKMTYADSSPLEPKATITAAEEADQEKFIGIVLGLIDGSESPIGEEATKLCDRRFIAQEKAAGRMFEGNFVTGNGLNDDGSYEIGMGAFADRQVAMINAYHYARAAGHATWALIMFNTSSVNPSRYGEQYGRAAFMAERDLVRPLSMLGRQFGFTGTTLATTEDGRQVFSGLTVTHEKYGKMLSIDPNGTVTLYDQSGKAYTEEAYNAAQPEGVIPELWNVVNGKTARLNVCV